ncbi:MAG: hypothetical protein EPN39_14630 [Chitinophagaceae bacterium]|jgi:hypothetical protein|nr:MAG: hypothetical protein EPN39_14630 [Chitinophagaceae bacterium]
MDNNLKRVNVKVFRADKNREDCQRYVEGHHKVLESYGVTQVTSANVDWMNEPYSYIIFVENADDGRALGGGRIQLDGGSLPIPVVPAIGKLDPRIKHFVKEKAIYRTGEYCGLWNSREVAGYGIGSIFLMRAGVAIIDQLRLGSLFAFASQATCNNSLRIGFHIVRTLGINGIFYYPKEDLIATALIIDDPLQLLGAEEDERKRIFDFRKNPIKKVIEKGPRGEIEANYNLQIPAEDIINKLPPELYQMSV